MSEQDVIYTAGLFDGEGYVSILHSDSRPNNYSIRVGISMTHLPTIDFLVSRFGGSFLEKKVTGNRKDQYTWYCGNKLALDFLEKVLPFLITKKNQAVLALSFPLTKRGSTGRNRPVLESIVIRRRTIYQDLMALNYRGRGDV